MNWLKLLLTNQTQRYLLQMRMFHNPKWRKLFRGSFQTKNSRRLQFFNWCTFLWCFKRKFNLLTPCCRRFNCQLKILAYLPKFKQIPKFKNKNNLEKLYLKTNKSRLNQLMKLRLIPVNKIKVLKESLIIWTSRINRPRRIWARVPWDNQGPLSRLPMSRKTLWCKTGMMMVMRMMRTKMMRSEREDSVKDKSRIKIIMRMIMMRKKNIQQRLKVTRHQLNKPTIRISKSLSRMMY